MKAPLNGVLIGGLCFGLAACGSSYTRDAYIPPDDSSSCCMPSPVLDGKDDAHRFMLKSDLEWRKHVAVASNDKAIETAAAKLVDMNFSIRRVPLKDAKFIIRVVSLSHETAIGLRFQAERDGRIIAQSRSISAHDDCDDANSDCTDFATRERHELALFKARRIQEEFLNFVQKAMDKAN